MIDALTTWLGERLLVGSLQGAAVVAVVWLACRFTPRMPASAQAMLWWLAALKLALVFVPAPAVPIAVLPADFERHTGQVVAPSASAVVSDAPSTPQPIVAAHARASNTVAPVASRIVWLRAIVIAWIAVLVVAIGRLVCAHHLLRGIVRRSSAWNADEIGSLAARLGLARVPKVRVSDEIAAPQVFGLWTPVVLVPADLMATFTPDERSMTLCHELMHIRRRDIALGWVPAIAERLFFFHPLARLSAREYVAARESACDAAVVKTLGVAPADYGRLLVRLGIDHPGTALAAHGAPFSCSSLKRRLQMLQHHHSDTLSPRWRWAILAAATVILPLQLAGRAEAIDPLPPAPHLDGVQALAAPPATAALERQNEVPPVASPGPSNTRPAVPLEALSRALDALAQQVVITAIPPVDRPSDYVIGPGDVLIFTAWDRKDLTADLLVRPDGRITVPLLNDVDAAGLTPQQLSERLQQALSKYLVEPRVTVGVRAINSRKVSITGGVAKPGQYSLVGPLRVLDLISLAGGLRQFSAARIVVIRNEGGKQVSFRVNYKELLNGSDLDQNILLRPGDTVLVSE